MAKGEVVDLMKLPAEVRTNLVKMENEIKDAKASISALKKLGMDVRILEDKLKWADEVRTTLLKEFS